MKKNKQFILTAIKENGRVLKYVDNSIKLDLVKKLLKNKIVKIKKLYTNINPNTKSDYLLKDIFGNTIHMDEIEISNSASGLLIKEFKNKIILLNITGTDYCPPCFNFRKSLVEIQKKYSNKVRVLSILAQESSRPELEEIVIKHNINYPIVSYSDKGATPFIKMVGENIGLTESIPLPLLIVIDSDGDVRNVDVSGSLSVSEVSKLVEEVQE